MQLNSKIYGCLLGRVLDFKIKLVKRWFIKTRASLQFLPHCIFTVLTAVPDASSVALSEASVLFWDADKPSDEESGGFFTPLVPLLEPTR